MLETLRTTLLITLAILVAVIIYRRVRYYIRVHHLPVPQEMRVVLMEVMYHPTTLRVVLFIPLPCKVVPEILDSRHEQLISWPTQELEIGEHVLELPMDGHQEGTYYFNLSTATQRTQRRFSIHEA